MFGPHYVVWLYWKFHSSGQRFGFYTSAGSSDTGYSRCFPMSSTLYIIMFCTILINVLKLTQEGFSFQGSEKLHIATIVLLNNIFRMAIGPAISDPTLDRWKKASKNHRDQAVSSTELNNLCNDIADEPAMRTVCLFSVFGDKWLNNVAWLSCPHRPVTATSQPGLPIYTYSKQAVNYSDLYLA